MIELIQVSQLLLSISLLVTAIKKDFTIATIMIILLFVLLFSIR